MTTYTDLRDAISRIPITLLELDLDTCARTFGVSPCLATGTPCYNTVATCRYRTAYSRITRTLSICSLDAPVPFAGPRPYLKSVKYLPTEIKTTISVTGRVTVEAVDEPDSDIGMDPYLSQRSSVQGAFWKKLLARNPNYQGRSARLYEGYLGMSLVEFHAEQRWAGSIDKITLGRGTVKVEIVDRLKGLANVSIPPKVDIKLVAGIAPTTGALTLTSVEGIPRSNGFVRIDDEIVGYGDADPTSYVLTGCARGAFGTTAADHTANDKVSAVAYYPPTNPFDVLKSMLLTDAEIPTAEVDVAAFDSARDLPGGECNVSAIVTDPTKLDKLFFEVVDLIDCRAWVGEDLRITIRRNLPNVPGRSYAAITDAGHIVHDSGAADLNPTSRISRVLLYWDKDPLKDLDAVDGYARLDIAVDADAEGADEYDAIAEHVIFCRWLRPGLDVEEILDGYVRDVGMRRVWMQRDPLELITVEVEAKDSGVKTGAFVALDTDELQSITGHNLAAKFGVVRRDPKGKTVALRLLRVPDRRIGWIAANDAPDFINATDAQREYCYISDADNTIDGAPGYHIW